MRSKNRNESINRTTDEESEQSYEDIRKHEEGRGGRNALKMKQNESKVKDRDKFKTRSAGEESEESYEDKRKHKGADRRRRRRRRRRRSEGRSVSK